MPGAASHILRTLEAFGLHWDDTVRYQSTRLERYQQVLAALEQEQRSYGCDCTRAAIRQRNGQHYDGHCRERHLPLVDNAIRFRNEQPVFSYRDACQGTVLPPRQWAAEDFLLRRRDGLIAYQLAVVVDDIEDGISEWVRGADLLLPSCWQLALYDAFGTTRPQLLHLPLLHDDNGLKLSKQNHAPALDEHRPQSALLTALAVLGQRPPAMLQDASVEELLQWAVRHWDSHQIPATTTHTFPSMHSAHS